MQNIKDGLSKTQLKFRDLWRNDSYVALLLWLDTCIEPFIR